MTFHVDGLGSFFLVALTVVGARLLYDVARAAGIAAAIALYRARPRSESDEGASVADRIRAARKAVR